MSALSALSIAPVFCMKNLFSQAILVALSRRVSHHHSFTVSRTTPRSSPATTTEVSLTNSSLSSSSFIFPCVVTIKLSVYFLAITDHEATEPVGNVFPMSLIPILKIKTC